MIFINRKMKEHPLIWTHFAQAGVIRFGELSSQISLSQDETGVWKWRDSRPVIWQLVRDIAFLSVWGIPRPPPPPQSIRPGQWFWPVVGVSAAGSHLVRLDVVVVGVFNYSKPCHVSLYNFMHWPIQAPWWKRWLWRWRWRGWWRRRPHGGERGRRRQAADTETTATTTTIFRQRHMWQRQKPQERQTEMCGGQSKETGRKTATEMDRESPVHCQCAGIPDSLTLLEPTNGLPFPPPPGPQAPATARWPDLAVWTTTTTITTTIYNNDHDHCLWRTETIENSKFIRWKKLISVAFFLFLHTFYFVAFCSDMIRILGYIKT